jgi:hypothetical protein
MQKEMLHGERDEAETTVAPEYAAVVVEALDGDGLVQWAALGTTDERHDGDSDERNDFIAVLTVARNGAEVEWFGGHSARDLEKRMIAGDSGACSTDLSI